MNQHMGAAKNVAAKEKLVEPKKKKTVAKKIAPEVPTPATPAASKILEEVRAKGTLKKTLPTQATKTEGAADASKTPATAPSKPAQPRGRAEHGIEVYSTLAATSALGGVGWVRVKVRGRATG